MSTERRRLAATLATAAALATTACNGTTSYLDATGAAGHDEAILGRWLTVVACVVVLFVCIAILLGLAKHRSDRERQSATGGPAARREIRSGLSWIYVGIGGTIVVLLLTFAGTMATLDAASHPPLVPALTVHVKAHQWWWEFRYEDPKNPNLGFVTANEVHLPIGKPVRVRLESDDVIHSFWMPQISGKTDVIPGQINEMWVEAKKPGVTRGMCAEYCGLQHAMMDFVVTAEPEAAFNQWAAERRQEAMAPTTGDAVAGKVVFERSCGACHAVAGSRALGRVGPDLTHFASRPWIGAGILPNTPANLANWIHHAPDIKQGARMPDVPLDSAETRSVVAYLQTLR